MDTDPIDPRGNPARILAAALTAQGEDLDPASVDAAAAVCDAPVTVSRYRVCDGSASGNWSIVAIVIDTTRGTWRRDICECQHDGDAELICAAMNAQHQRGLMP